MTGVIYATTESGCIVPTNRKLNADGYYRCRDSRFTGLGRKPLIMNHRLVWLLAGREIPEGHEIDHKCRNRSCCNVEHLQVLEGSAHAAKTNRERYASRKERAYFFWKTTSCSGSKLAITFNVSFSSACGWIREWKV